jgi:small subunit ribosomal protein S2
MRELLEAGVHFGHQTRRWNPKMRRYIFGERGASTSSTSRRRRSCSRRRTTSRGTSRSATARSLRRHEEAGAERRRGERDPRRHAVRQQPLARRPAHQLADDLERIAYLHDLRRLKAEGQLDLLPSKERLAMEADLEKLEANLGGVADMKRQPDAVFVLDLKKEQLAVRETHRLGVPVIGLVDTNADPDEAEFVIPETTTPIRSCDLVARVVADGVAAGRTKVTAAEMTTPVPAEPAAEEAAAASEPEPELETATGGRRE